MGIFDKVIDKTKEIKSEYDQRKKLEKEDRLNIKDEELKAKDLAIKEKEHELHTLAVSLTAREKAVQQKEKRTLHVFLLCLIATGLGFGYFWQNYEFVKRVVPESKAVAAEVKPRPNEASAVGGESVPTALQTEPAEHKPDVESTSQSMSFQECLQVIQRTSSQLGVAPINIVETSIMRMVRFPTNDGSVLVTCSGPDRKMVLTHSK